MQSLNVDPDALSAFALSSVAKAGAVRNAVTTGGKSGPAFQPTSRGIAAAGLRVEGVSAVLADRIEDLTSKLSTAAKAYVNGDLGSATAIGRTMDAYRL